MIDKTAYCIGTFDIIRKHVNKSSPDARTTMLSRSG